MIAMLLPMVVAMAQSDVARVGQLPKQGMKLNVSQLENTFYSGVWNGQTFWLVERERMRVNLQEISQVKIERYDATMNNTGTLKLEDARDKEVLAASLVDGKMYILMKGRPNRNDKAKKPLALTCSVIDLSKMTVSELKRIGEMDHGASYGVACSPSRDFFALALPATNSAHVVLYDNRFGVLWERDVDCGNVVDVYVNDEGEVALASVGTKRVGVTVVDAKDYAMFNVSLGENSPTGLRVLNYAGDYVTLGGRLFNPEEKNNGLFYVGYFGVAVNTRTGVGRQTCRLFTDEELNVLINGKATKSNKTKGISDVQCRATVALPYGGAMLMEDAFKQVITTRNMQTGAETSKIEYLGFGEVLFAVDTTGKIAWSHPVRRLVMSRGRNFLREELLTKGDLCYLVQCESKKSSPDYDISKNASIGKLLAGNTPMAIYRVDREGRVVKQKVKLPSSSVMYGVLERNGNGRYTLAISTRASTKPMEVELY